MTDNQSSFKPFLPIVAVFAITSGLLVVFSKTLLAKNINSDVIIYGNVLLFAVAILSYFFYRKALVAGNTATFLRHVYSGLLIKLFVCGIAAFIYIYLAGKNVNTGALFSLMFLYLLYTFIEVSGAMRLSKSIKNSQLNE